MPIEHHVDSDDGILVVRRWGPVSTQDEQRACIARRDDPAVVPGIAVLVDCREVQPPDSAETVRYVADCVTRLAAELSCGPVAIVVASDVQYGMARMYMSLTDPVHAHTEVFRDLAAARAWLFEERA